MVDASVPRTSRANGEWPVVFLGPSLSRAEAEALVQAEFRPPIRRGDLEAVEPGRTVLILDGEFDQTLSVSPKELLRKIDGGSRVFGASSMGALRAAELHGLGMRGVGWIYESYRTGRIVGDDEVALAYCPFTFEPRSIPLVNIRFWLDRLQEVGLVEPAAQQRLLRRARRVFYAERTSERLEEVIARTLQLATRASIADAGLETIPDIKAADARRALATVRSLATFPSSLSPLGSTP
jgi:hypothetical protein